LKEALHRDIEHLCVPSPFVSAAVSATVRVDLALQETSIPMACSFDIPGHGCTALRCKAMDSGDEHAIFAEWAPRDDLGGTFDVAPLVPILFLDAASILVAHALDAQPEERVLDACAAPGGKAFVLAAAMFGGTCLQGGIEKNTRGRLVLNDASKKRANRMQSALKEYLPPLLFDAGGVYGPLVVFSSADAGTPCNTMERHGPYDKILFDAPCVCDRQLLREGDTGKLGSWSAGTIKASSDRQVKWLSNALWLLKENGVLLYCTTALSYDECDGVVQRLLTNARGTFELDVLPLMEDVCRMVPCLAAETTDWGTRILPDKAPIGPVFFSRIRLLRRTHHAVKHIPC